MFLGRLFYSTFMSIYIYIVHIYIFDWFLLYQVLGHLVVDSGQLSFHSQSLGFVGCLQCGQRGTRMQGGGGLWMVDRAGIGVTALN